MATTTTNYSLVKPSPVDPVDITVINHNLDVIDRVLNAAEVFIKAVGSGIDPTGTTESTSAIQTKLASVPSGGCLVFPAGTFLVHGLHLTASNVAIRGQGRGITTLKLKDSTNDYVLYCNTPGLADFSISDLTVDGNKANNTSAGTAISFQGTSATVAPITGIRIDRVNIVNPNGIGIGIGGATDFSVSDCQVTSSGDNGFDCNGVARGTYSSCTAKSAATDGFFVGDHTCSDVTYLSCSAVDCGHSGFDVDAITGDTVVDIRYVACTSTGVTTYDGWRVVGDGTVGSVVIQLVSCQAKAGARDGYAVGAAASATFGDCRATGNAGKGVEDYGSAFIQFLGGDLSGNNTAGLTAVTSRYRDTVGKDV